MLLTGSLSRNTLLLLIFFLFLSLKYSFHLFLILPPYNTVAITTLSPRGFIKSVSGLFNLRSDGGSQLQWITQLPELSRVKLIAGIFCPRKGWSLWCLMGKALEWIVWKKANKQKVGNLILIFRHKLWILTTQPVFICKWISVDCLTMTGNCVYCDMLDYAV